MSRTLENAVLRFVQRHWVETLAFCYLAVMVWVGWVPFDFGAVQPAGSTDAESLGLPLAALHLPDVLSNVALYVPLGLFLRAVLLRQGWRRISSLPAVLLVGFAVSYVTEFGQLYLPSRVSSVVDLMCNVGGTLLGALSASAALAILDLGFAFGRRGSDRLREAVRARPSAVAAQVVAGVLLVASVAPFDLTFSPNRVYRSVLDTRLTPFTLDARLSESIMSAGVSPGERSAPIAARERWQVRLDWAWTFCGYLVLAVLVYRYLSRHCRVADLRRGVWTVCACGMLAVLATGARVLIISRTADVTDVVLALLGSACGVLFADRLVEMWGVDTNSRRVRFRRQRLAGGVLAVWCVWLAARELAPFTPDVSPASMARRVASIEWLPMQTYQQSRLPTAVDDLLTKTTRYLALGVLLGFRRSLRQPDDDAPGIFSSVLLAAALVATLEALQVLLPSRVPAITDVLVAALATGAGAIAFRTWQAFLRPVPAEASDATVATPVDERILFNVEFDPASPAPIERVPERPTAPADLDSGGD